ncbi:MAG: tetratricopeptide repeat protein [Flavobacterium sp.]|nr:tetratricopeptide repeat protein [Flavobacterium sp.]
MQINSNWRLFFSLHLRMLLFFALVLFQTTGYSQTPKQYLERSKTYRKTNIDSAIYYAGKGYDLAKSNNNKQMTAENAAFLGDYYTAKNQFNAAKKYYTIYTNYLSDKNDPSAYCGTLMIVGNIELLQNNYIKALQLYYKCLDIAKANNLTHILPHLYNNLGNLYFEIEDFKEAKAFFTIAHRQFRANKDSYNAALALTNISNIYAQLGENQLAIKGYLDVLKTLSANGSWEDVVSGYHSLAKIYNKEQQYALAEDYNNKAMQLILKNEKGSSNYLGPITFYKAEVYATAAELFFNRNEIDKAAQYAHKSLGLSYANSYTKNIYENANILSKIFDKKKQVDSALFYNKLYIKYSENYKNEYDLKKIVQLKMQYQFDDILKAKAIEEVKKQSANKRVQLIYLGISIFTFLGVIIMILLYRNQKVKTAKILITQEKLELEKTALDQEVEYKRKELTSKMIYLLEKNEFIVSIGKKLTDLKPNLSKEDQAEVQQLINELKNNSSNKIWDEFEMRFKEVHSAFYDNLNKLYPDLSPNEIKICAFLRLNMTTKEISAITHQSIKSINVARFRLRKKLDIETEENLISFLIQV